MSSRIDPTTRIRNAVTGFLSLPAQLAPLQPRDNPAVRVWHARMPFALESNSRTRQSQRWDRSLDPVLTLFALPTRAGISCLQDQYNPGQKRARRPEQRSWHICRSTARWTFRGQITLQAKRGRDQWRPGRHSKEGGAIFRSRFPPANEFPLWKWDTRLRLRFSKFPKSMYVSIWK